MHNNSSHQKQHPTSTAHLGYLPGFLVNGVIYDLLRHFDNCENNALITAHGRRETIVGSTDCCPIRLLRFCLLTWFFNAKIRPAVRQRVGGERRGQYNYVIQFTSSNGQCCNLLLTADCEAESAEYTKSREVEGNFGCRKDFSIADG